MQKDQTGWESNDKHSLCEYVPDQVDKDYQKAPERSGKGA